MRPTLIALITLLACGTAAISSLNRAFAYDSRREIQWTEDFEGAVQNAQTTNRPLLLHFYGDACPPCKLLDKKTFHDAGLVETINGNVVPVKINADRRRDLADHYKVTRWPTDVYLFPNGDEIYRNVSHQDPAVYSKTVERIALRHRDWTIEQSAALKAKQRRQDQQIAAHTPQRARTDMLQYSGSEGRSIETGSATQNPQSNTANPPNGNAVAGKTVVWTNRTPDSVNISAVPNQQSSTEAQSAQANRSANASRVVRNPYASEPESVVNDIAKPLAHNSINAPDASYVSHSIPKPNQVAPNFTVAQNTVAVNDASNTQIETQDYSTASSPSSEPPTAPQAAEQEVAPELDVGMGGFCPVTLKTGIEQKLGQAWVRGDRQFAVRHRGRVYLCASEECRQQLLRNPDYYTPAISGFDLVHFMETGKFIDGYVQYGLIQDGRIFLFAKPENNAIFQKYNEHFSKVIENQFPERVANEPNPSVIR